MKLWTVLESFEKASKEYSNLLKFSHLALKALKKIIKLLRSIQVDFFRFQPAQSLKFLSFQESKSFQSF
jgi:hypothetical protein